MKLTKAMVMVAALLAVGAGTSEAGVAKKPGKQVSGVVNLNQATAQQLDLLPGVGAKAAQRIMDYRRKTPFARPEELVKVKGFGKKKFEKLKVHLAVAGPTTLKQIGGSEKSEQGRSAPVAR